MRTSHGMLLAFVIACATPGRTPAQEPSLINPLWTNWVSAGIPDAFVRYGCAGPNAFANNQMEWFVELKNVSDENLHNDFEPYIYGRTTVHLSGGLTNVIAPGEIHRAEGVMNLGCEEARLLRIAINYRFEPIPGSRRYVAPGTGGTASAQSATRPRYTSGQYIDGGSDAGNCMSPASECYQAAAAAKRKADAERLATEREVARRALAAKERDRLEVARQQTLRDQAAAARLQAADVAARRDSVRHAADVAQQQAQRQAEQQAEFARQATLTRLRDSVLKADRREAEERRAQERQATAEQSRAAQEAAAQTAAAGASSAMSHESVNAQKNLKQLSALFTVNMAVSLLSVPSWTNDSDPFGASTSAGSVSGYGGMVGVELWPFVSEYFGVGGFGSYQFGVASTESDPSSTVDSHSRVAQTIYGMRAYVGVPGFAIVGEAASTDEVATATAEFSSAGVPSSSANNSDLSGSRVGAGLRLGTIKSGGVEAMYFTQKFTLLPGTTATVWRGRITMQPLWVNVEHSGNYPVAGVAAQTSTDSPIGSYWNAQLGYSYRFFARY
jgi:hypothetical protein